MGVAFNDRRPAILDYAQDAGVAMYQRNPNMLWLNDLLEHLAVCRSQLEWASDPQAVRVLTETMLRDLETCRRLCQALTPPAPQPQAA